MGSSLLSDLQGQIVCSFVIERYKHEQFIFKIFINLFQFCSFSGFSGLSFVFFSRKYDHCNLRQWLEQVFMEKMWKRQNEIKEKWKCYTDTPYGCDYSTTEIFVEAGYIQEITSLDSKTIDELSKRKAQGTNKIALHCLNLQEMRLLNF